MQLDLKLSTSQIKQIASYISLQDIQNSIQKNPKEYEKILNEDTILNTKDDVSQNIQKNCNNKWIPFIDDTICKIKLENKAKGGEQK